jgi:hypothetical protein
MEIDSGGIEKHTKDKLSLLRIHFEVDEIFFFS